MILFRLLTFVACFAVCNFTVAHCGDNCSCDAAVSTCVVPPPSHHHCGRILSCLFHHHKSPPVHIQVVKCGSSKEEAALPRDEQPAQAANQFFSAPVIQAAMPAVAAMPMMPMMMPMAYGGYPQVQAPQCQQQTSNNCSGCIERVERLEKGVSVLSDRMDKIENILENQVKAMVAIQQSIANISHDSGS